MDATSIIRNELNRSHLPDLAKTSGLPQRTLYGYAKEDVEPTLGKTEQICKALGLEFYIGPPRPKNLNNSQSYSDLDGKKEYLNRRQMILAVRACEQITDHMGKDPDWETKAEFALSIYDMIEDDDVDAVAKILRMKVA